MARTYDEMCTAAAAQRAKMIGEGRDPYDGVFVCTAQEKLFILDQPPFMVYELSVARDRIYGLKIALLDSPTPNTFCDERHKTRDA